MIKIWPSSVRDAVGHVLLGIAHTVNPGRHEAALTGVVAPEPAAPPCGAETHLAGSQPRHGGQPHICLCTRPAGHTEAERESEQYHRCGQVGGCGAVWLSIELEGL